MSYNVTLDQFEGPLDLLLHLITVNQIDIYDIPISRITDAYIMHLEEAKALDIQIAGSFMVMLATLLEIKSRMLLPLSDHEMEGFTYLDEDPRTSLVEKLIQYRQYKSAADLLLDRESSLDRMFFKDQDDLGAYVEDDQLPEMTQGADLLLRTVRRLIAALPEIDENRERFFKTLKRDVHTVEQSIVRVRLLLDKEGTLSFLNLAKDADCKEAIVVIFLSLLELLKLGEITVMQDQAFDDMTIMRKEEVPHGEESQEHH